MVSGPISRWRVILFKGGSKNASALWADTSKEFTSIRVDCAVIHGRKAIRTELYQHVANPETGVIEAHYKGRRR